MTPATLIITAICAAVAIVWFLHARDDLNNSRYGDALLHALFGAGFAIASVAAVAHAVH